MKRNSIARGPLVHLGILAIAATAATTVWTRDKEPKGLSQGDVTMWSGRAKELEHVGYESKTRKIDLTVKSDALGRYFVGVAERDAPTPAAAADAGAPPPAAPRTKTTFVSVSAGDTLAEALAPLKALRALGHIGDDRAAEFGLAEPEATVTVKIAGAEHKLLVGGPTPGGGDRYVKDAASSEVYVVHGEPMHTLESADSAMMERELHEWKEPEVTSATIEAGGKKRAMVRGGAEGKKFWADEAHPDDNDETLGNWMAKLDRLRPTEYLPEPPPGKEVVVHLSYLTGRQVIGHVEVVKAPGAAGKPEYYLESERTRLYAKVPGTLAEQLEQDLPGILK